MNDPDRGLLEATRYTFSSDGSPDVVWHVRRFTLVESLSEPYALTLELATDDLSVDTLALLGAACQLRIDRDVTARAVFGLVTRVRERGVLADRLHVDLDVVPALALSAHVVNTRFFQEQSVPDILRQVLEAALEPLGRTLRLDLDPAAYEPREYCVQFRESDLDFAARLMHEEGILYYFEHPPEGSAELLVLAGASDRCRPLALVDGGDVVDFVARRSGTAARECVDTFTPSHALRTTSVAQRDFDWLHPADSPYARERRSRDARGRDRESFEHDDRRLFRDDGARRSRRKLEQRAAEEHLHLGTGDVAEFNPGFTFALLGHPQHHLDREYLIVRATHRGDAPEEDRFAGSPALPRYTNEFDAIAVDTPWRPPPPPAGKPRTHGPQTAIVVGPAGEEIHTDEHGRIKVHFHWDRISPFDDTASCWIRVAQRLAGPQWGSLSLPRIGMEVVVDFLDGDPDRPLVTGCVYNGNNPPPYPLPDQKTKTTLKSESSPGGGGFNEIRFEDAKSGEELFIHAQRDMTTKVLRDAGRQVDRDDGGKVGRHQNHEVGVDRTAKVGNDETLSVGNNQSLSVGVDQTLSVGANQSLSVGANQSETVTGNQTIAVSGNQSESISGNQTLAVSGNQSATVGGSQTLSVTGSQTIAASGSQSVTVGGSGTTSVTGALTLQAGGAANLTFSAAHNLTVGAARSSTIGGSDTLSVTGALSITAASITLSAGGSTIEIGPAGITITAGALVSISGATVKVNT